MENPTQAAKFLAAYFRSIHPDVANSAVSAQLMQELKLMNSEISKYFGACRAKAGKK